jgi:ectoine hydroxylase-related dioxygenase (phytanoyl-CoA dioxygenase family)
MNTKTQFNTQGFAIINNFYTNPEIETIIANIDKKTSEKSENKIFLQSKDLFAIRQFLQEFPEIFDQIFNQKLKDFINENFGDNYFITKSIYFDKPPTSNWFVAYHQDLTISVDKKTTIKNFENWTVKQNQFAVQPPKEILEKNFTIRIHLDKTTTENGALKVLNKSHQNGITRIEDLKPENHIETHCEIEKGGIMLMKPLLFHASNKTTNQQRRRVIHIELSNQTLPTEINWSEKSIF